MSKLKKNLGYQTIYQILNTCIPLITSPYLARVLGAEKQGVFSYTQSIINYFTLFAMLGVENYGTRTIANCGDDREKRSKSFWNIYFFQMCCTLLSIGIYVVYLTRICSQNVYIAFLQIFYLLGSLVDINWLFFGVEKFKTTVSRNMIIRISSVVLILSTVRKPSDLWIYTLIMAGSTFLSNIILWFFASKEVDVKAIRTVSKKEVVKHIKPNLVLFVPLMAMSVYHIMDKTMLGLLSTYKQVGYYYNADKIINIPIGILIGIGTVMLPRMTALNSNGLINEAKKLFLLSIELIVAVSSAMACGIFAISVEFTPLFFGSGYDECIRVIMMLSPGDCTPWRQKAASEVLPQRRRDGLSEIARMQYLIPNQKEKIFIESVFWGAGINLIVNLLLIVRLGALGAAIGTMAAELVSCFWQYKKINKYISCSSVIYKSMVYVLFGVVMIIVVRIVARIFCGGIVALVFEILTGVVVYSLLCIGYWKLTKNKILSVIKLRR